MCVCVSALCVLGRGVPCSEKIALGLAQQSGQDMQFDQRLFNQTEGMDSGFGAEDGSARPHARTRTRERGERRAHEVEKGAHCT